jgi:hypothetical protein
MEQGIAVGLGGRDLLRDDDAIGAGTIFDYHLLLHVFRHFLGNRAAHAVIAATRRKN